MQQLQCSVCLTLPNRPASQLASQVILWLLQKAHKMQATFVEILLLIRAVIGSSLLWQNHCCADSPWKWLQNSMTLGQRCACVSTRHSHTPAHPPALAGLLQSCLVFHHGAQLRSETLARRCRLQQVNQKCVGCKHNVGSAEEQHADSCTT